MIYEAVALFALVVAAQVLLVGKVADALTALHTNEAKPVRGLGQHKHA